MKRFLVLTIAAAAAAALTACSQKETAPAEAAAPPASPAAASAPPAAEGEMAGMDMPAGAKMAKGTGTVTAVGADSVTVDHAAIPEAGWPAMSMAFKASPELAKTVKAGDKVAFDLKLEGGGGEITAITKQ